MRELARIAVAIAVITTGAARAEDYYGPEDRGPITQHALWKIEGGRQPVYLLGSIHVLRRQNYPLERPIEEAFDEANVVAFEIDMETARDRMAHPKPPSVRPAKARPFPSQVTPATHRAVIRYLEDAGYPGNVFDQFAAPFVAGALVQMELRKLGFDPEWGVDAYFYRRARKYGKTVVPLETVDEQLEALDGLSDRGSDELVQAALQDAAGLRTELRDLIRAWKGGEVDRLTRLVNGSFSDRPEVYQRVLVERNARWIAKIEALLDGDVPALVIVGMGHLVGSDSVVAMLEAKGHVVKQQ